MLEFLYSADYEMQTEANNDAIESPLVTHAMVYALAEKYCIPVLKKVSKQKFVTVLEKDWKHESFPRAIEIVYTTTVPQDRGLRNAVISVVLQHKAHMQQQASFMLLIKDLGDFAVGVVSRAWSCVNEGDVQILQLDTIKRTRNILL